MEFWIKAAQLLLSLSILIIVHELGHFLPAKWFKTKVEKFYLFFDAGFSLFKFKKGETEYGIGWLPLGGYVKIAGMVDESLDKEALKQEPQPWEFRSKPAWQRLIIMLGGVTVNLIVGFFIYMMIVFAWGTEKVSSDGLKYGFSVSPIMEELGFQQGDKVLSVDGEVLENVLDVNNRILVRDAQIIEVMHLDGTKESINLPEDLDHQLFAADQMNAFTPRFHAIIDSVLEDTPGQKAGLLKGDTVVGINGNPIVYWDELTSTVAKNKNKTIVMNVMRKDSVYAFSIALDSLAKVGVMPYVNTEEIITIDTISYGFFGSISKGFSFGYWTLHDYVAQFKFVFTSKGSTAIGGFASIGKMFPGTWDWLAFWERTALISIILAFMNILPIPALDGGHVVFLLFEMITGRVPSEKFLIKAQIIGFVILISLLLYANGLDIYRAIVGG
jgi:regulator of sigma E protease